MGRESGFSAWELRKRSFSKSPIDIPLSHVRSYLFINLSQEFDISVRNQENGNIHAAILVRYGRDDKATKTGRRSTVLPS